LVKRTKKSLSELAQAMTAVPQVLVNVQVTKKPRLESIPDIDRAMQESERRLNGCGRVLIRYSGTEPLLRIMVEGEQSIMVKEVAEELARVVRKHIG
jgi:phosphoglucosamine mutase